MDINNLKKKVQQLLKQKNIGSLVIILLVVIMIYLIVSYFTDVNNISSSVETITESEKQQPVDTNDIGKELRDYEAKQEESLKSILKQIEGVGNVEVKINFDGSEVKVPAMDSTVQKSTTEETDGSSGKRVNNQETNGDTIVMTSKENGNEPFILKTDKPNITGVMVVAEGANDSKIKYEITKAVSGLYDISMDKVNVLSMKK